MTEEDLDNPPSPNKDDSQDFAGQTVISISPGVIPLSGSMDSRDSISTSPPTHLDSHAAATPAATSDQLPDFRNWTDGDLESAGPLQLKKTVSFSIDGNATILHSDRHQKNPSGDERQTIVLRLRLDLGDDVTAEDLEIVIRPDRQITVGTCKTAPADSRRVPTDSNRLPTNVYRLPTDSCRLPTSDVPLTLSISKEKLDLLLMTEKDMMVKPNQVTNQYVHALLPLSDTDTSSVLNLVPFEDLPEEMMRIELERYSDDRVNPRKAASLEDIFLWGLSTSARSQGSVTSVKPNHARTSKPESHTLAGENGPAAKNTYATAKEIAMEVKVSRETLDLRLMTDNNLLVLPGEVANQYICTLTPLSDAIISSVCELPYYSALDAAPQFNSISDADEWNLMKANSLENIFLWGLPCKSDSQGSTASAGSNTSFYQYPAKKDAAYSHLNNKAVVPEEGSNMSVLSVYNQGAAGEEKKLVTAKRTRMIMEVQRGVMSKESMSGRPSHYNQLAFNLHLDPDSVGGNRDDKKIKFLLEYNKNDPVVPDSTQQLAEANETNQDMTIHYMDGDLRVVKPLEVNSSPLSIRLTVDGESRRDLVAAQETPRKIRKIQVSATNAGVESGSMVVEPCGPPTQMTIPLRNENMSMTLTTGMVRKGVEKAWTGNAAVGQERCVKQANPANINQTVASTTKAAGSKIPTQGERPLQVCNYEELLTDAQVPQSKPKSGGPVSLDDSNKTEPDHTVLVAIEEGMKQLTIALKNIQTRLAETDPIRPQGRPVTLEPPNGVEREAPSCHAHVPPYSSCGSPSPQYVRECHYHLPAYPEYPGVESRAPGQLCPLAQMYVTLSQPRGAPSDIDGGVRKAEAVGCNVDDQDRALLSSIEGQCNDCGSMAVSLKMKPRNRQIADV